MNAEVVTSIGTLDQWKAFVTSVSNGDDYSSATVTLTTDIEMQNSGFGNQTIGTSDHPFTGTFDGGGHTLTYNNTGLTKLPYCAPFRYIKNATIKNVKIAGTITVADNSILGGIVGYVGGSSTSDVSYIDNCVSSITLTNSAASGDGRIGGIVGYQLATSGLQITNCLVEGPISSNSSQAAGVMGYKKDGASLSVSSVYLTSTITGKVNTFVKSEGGSQTITKCYTTISSPDQGTEATTAMQISGEVTYELQNGQATQYWGQAKLNTSVAELSPEMTSDDAKKVIKLTATEYTGYANKGGALPAPISAGGLSLRKWDSENSKWLNGPFEEDMSLSIKYNRYVLNVTSAGYTTLVLPVGTTSLPTNVEAYNLSFTSGSDVATASPVDKITKNKPVLIKAPEGQYVFETTNNDEAGTVSYDTENAHQNGVLYGIYTNTYKFVPKDSYVLQKKSGVVGFYKVDAADKIRITSFRAYMTPETEAREFLGIDFADNNPTGISTMSKSVEVKNNEYYNLSGQRVAQPQKGLYIVNGKKYVVK